METKDPDTVENTTESCQTTCVSFSAISADDQTTFSKTSIDSEKDANKVEVDQTISGINNDVVSIESPPLTEDLIEATSGINNDIVSLESPPLTEDLIEATSGINNDIVSLESPPLTEDLIEDIVPTEDVNTSNGIKQQSASQIFPSSLPSGGLGLLAQYESDIESDSNDGDSNSVVEVPIASETNNYRKQTIEVVSDTDSDVSNDSDKEVEYLSTLRKEIVKTMQTVDDDDEDEDGGDDSKPRRRLPPKVKGEMLLDDLPPIEDLKITVPEEECIELGRIHSIVDQLVLVSALPNSMLFDLETVLFLEKGHKVLGEVFDVLGQVADPLYCVRFNSNQQIKDRNINVGEVVYCAPKTEYTQFVILSKLMQMRGSDASWENDIEPPPRYLDYSDDEEERDARTQWRNRDRPNEHNDLSKRTRTDSTICDDSASQSFSQTFRPRNRQRERNVTREATVSNANRNHPREQQYNYHPSYNSGSWHSNYYHNYHPSVDNYNLPPPSHVMHPAYSMPYSYPPPYAMPGYSIRPPTIPPNYPHQMYPQPPVGPLPPPPPPS